MKETLIRQWLMLRAIPRAPRKISTGRLVSLLEAQGHATTLRTVQRDLNALSTVFPLVGDDSKPQGWSWSKDAQQIDLPSLDEMTAVSFGIAEQALRFALPESVLSHLNPWSEMARDTLKSSTAQKDVLAGSFRVLSRSYRLTPPLVRTEVQQSVYEALLGRKRLQIVYKARGAAIETGYLINPLAFVILDSTGYLICTFTGYEDVRLIALHRIIEAQVTEKKVARPSGFNLDKFISEGHLSFLRSRLTLNLVFLMKSDVALHLNETPIAPDQLIRRVDNSWVKVTASVPDSQQLRWWLRGFGPNVEVLRPKALRREFENDVTALKSLYSDRLERRLADEAESSSTDSKKLRFQDLAIDRNEYQDILSTDECVLNALQ